MPDTKTTSLADLAAPDASDLLMIVDVSDTTMAASGTNKKTPVSAIHKTLVALRWVIGAGTDVTTGTVKGSVGFTIPYAGVIKRATIRAGTGPSGAALIVDINKNGTSIWNTTQANRLQIAAGSLSGSQATFDTTSVAQDDVITLDVDQIGSSTAGQNVMVELWVLIDNPTP